MDAAVVRELGMEGGSQQSALPHQHWKTVPLRHYFDSIAHTGNAWGTDVHHLQGTTGQAGFAGSDGAIDLPAVGVPLHADVHDREALLWRRGDFASQQDAAGAGAEGRLFGHKTLKR